MIKAVRNPDVINLTKLPPVSFIREMYEKDSQVSENTIKTVCDAYEKKIDICRQIQLGKDPFRLVYAAGKSKG